MSVIDDQLAPDIASLYRASATPRMVDVPELRFLMIDGHGDPDTSDDFRDAVQAVFTLSYALKFAIKKAVGSSDKVAPLEALWWARDIAAFATGDKASWDWTAMIRQPRTVTAEMYAAVVEDVMEKKPLAALSQVRLVDFAEGRAGQILHVGPYSTEGPTIATLHDFLGAQGCRFDGTVQKHHEIYLGDPRRAAPERLRTIIRQPVA